MKKILLISFLLILSGCTKLEFALDWADTYVLSYLTDYFDLSSSQKKETKSEFKTTLNEIRRQDFPKLVASLEGFRSKVEQNDLSRKTFESYIKDTQTLIQTSLQRFESLGQRLIHDQAINGFKSFDAEFEKKYQSDYKKFSDPKRLAKEQRKKIDRWLDESIEYLTDDQEDSLERFIEKNPLPNIQKLESRKGIFEKFKASRGEDKTRINFVKSFFEDWASLQTPEYLRAQKQYQENLIDWLTELSQSLTEKQKKNLIGNLNSRIEELKKLSLP